MNSHTECDFKVCDKCHKKCLSNSELTVHIEITHLCSDIPAHFMIRRDIKTIINLHTKCVIIYSMQNLKEYS